MPGLLWLLGAFPPRDFLGAFVASNFLGALPPVDLRAVILALVMGAIFGLLTGLRGVAVFWNLCLRTVRKRLILTKMEDLMVDNIRKKTFVHPKWSV